MSRILIIEDDKNMAMGLQFNLQSEGYTVAVCNDGESGLAAITSGEFDLLVLDWMLPGMDGLEVLRALRSFNVAVPVLLLTARDSKADIVEGLDNGADDYLTKPFDLNILVARIRSLLRSRAWINQKHSTKEAKIGDCLINFESFDVVTKDKTFKLSYKEAMIMKLFWEKPNQVITREELLKEVWGIEEYIQSRTVDNYIVQLRKIFEKDPKKPQMILSIHGSGYKFLPDK